MTESLRSDIDSGERPKSSKEILHRETRLHPDRGDALWDAGYLVDQISVAESRHRARARHLVPSDEARFRPGGSAHHEKPRGHTRETESANIGDLRHQEAALGTRGRSGTRMATGGCCSNQSEPELPQWNTKRDQPMRGHQPGMENPANMGEFIRQIASRGRGDRQRGRG